MNFSEIRRLVKLVESSQIAELEIEEENTRIRILKVSQSIQAAPAAEMLYQAGQPQDPAFAAQMSQPSASPPQPVAAASAKETEVNSPMVGTFYRAPSPEAPSYVQVGDHVRPGQALCIIEAMKLMNEIESEVSGTIKFIAAENAQPVEFGQLLFKIEQD